MPEPIGKTTNKGKIIPKVPFKPRYILKNYKTLLTNKTFCLSTLAVGIIGIPCVSWIALAPVMLITEGKLTAIEYGLWQLPIFSATIIGNWLLHRLTYKYTIRKIMFVGCIILALGTSLMAILPYFYGNHYYYLIPGVIVYFFALSILNAPLNRFCLFITSVSKGTASAIISLSVMTIGAIGIEIANIFYSTHSNLAFGLYNNAVVLVFLLLMSLAFLTNSSHFSDKDSK
jgi:DHA1 family multidrug/chloramphenicol efflux transport protein-like MFS transporter